MLQVLSFSDITEVKLSKNKKHTVEVFCSSVGYSIGLNCDSWAEKFLKDLQQLHSSHQQLYRYAMTKSHHGSVGKLLQVDGMYIWLCTCTVHMCVLSVCILHVRT